MHELSMTNKSCKENIQYIMGAEVKDLELLLLAFISTRLISYLTQD